MADPQFSILSKPFFLFLGVGVGVFLGLSLFGNWGAVTGAFKDFAYWTLPLILALAFMNYLVRFRRWELYLKRGGISLPRKESFYIFIYAFSTLAGALSMLPGGMGAAEGSMTSLLLLIQVPKALATTATIIVRICTIWFAVILGYGFLKLNQKQKNK